MNVYDITPEERAEWDRRTALDRPDMEALADPLWRLAHLYDVWDEKGKEWVPFAPTEEQTLVILCIYLRGWCRIIIPKARQLGLSTVLMLIGLDRCAFNEGERAALIDKTLDDAKIKLSDKAAKVWERVHPGVRANVAVEPLTDHLTFTAPGSEPSEFFVSSSVRGGTLTWLHISEWGEIQMRKREVSREIASGSLPAIERAGVNGVCVVETTWQGGLDDGELGPLANEALTTPEELKGQTSWRILFFPWISCPLYTQEHGYIDPESAAYFAKVEPLLGVTLTDGQKRWYAEKRRSLGNRAMRSQYPTIVSECWENSPEGSIYGAYLDKARSEGRIREFWPDRLWPVHTFWDIGHPLNTVSILAQITPAEIRILDCDMERDVGMPERAAWLRALGWDYGNHHFPHDAGIKQSKGMCQADEFRQVLGPTVRIVPRVADVWHGIRATQAIFSRFVFRVGNDEAGQRVAKLVAHLGRYYAVRETTTGVARDEPVHDRYSHAADALRQMGQAISSGMVEHGNAVGSIVPGSGPNKPRVIIAWK